jgi:hypothetical protein
MCPRSAMMAQLFQGWRNQLADVRPGILIW